MMILQTTTFAFLTFGILGLNGCNQEGVQKVQLDVIATAYTSNASQTDDTPFLAAWNNQLKPGVKSIAVSRDLLEMGLKNGSKVSIVGLPGEYVVLDKMHRRWEKKIDIYMGLDHDQAKQWGKQKVTIQWVADSI